ncbi:MAG: CpaF family protein [Chloroflexota bacterium]|jgi:pilus assembly protein CpaF
MLLFGRNSPKQGPQSSSSKPIVADGPVATSVQEMGEDTFAPPDPFADLKYRIHERLIKDMDLTRLNGKDRDAVRPHVEEAVAALLAAQDTPLSRQERQRLMREIADEILGLGPLEPLIKDPTITEVMVNRYNQVYFERDGLLYLSPVSFRDEAHIMRIIEKIIAPLGRRVDESSPMVDARLPDGSRVNVIIPPLAVDGPSITIRKFSRDPFTMEDLISFGTLTPEMAEFFESCVKTRLNILISGGTGTGKTTFLNVLSSFIPSRERIVTIEDPCELQLRQPNVVRLETRPPNIENKGEVTQRQLVRNALRMRPDRIIVGEVRTGEAFDMLQAMNTGHNGSLTTVHANSPRDALARVENMVMMANLDLPVRAIREQVASAINIIIQLSRMRDGVRRIVQVSEIAGMEGEIITLQEIFVFRQTGIDQDGRVLGRCGGTGLRSRFADHFVQHGIHLPPEIFAQRREGER